MLDKLAQKGLSLSIIVGTLLVPLTALAAIWLTDPDQGTDVTSAPTPAAPITTVTRQPTTAATIDIAADLETACGPEGTQLVSLEASESITDVQQAALDALREVCEQHGIPLPPKAVADPIVRTVVVPAATAASPSPGSTPTTSDDEDHQFEDDEYDDDRAEHEDEEDNDNQEDNDDHEDHESENDDHEEDD